MGLDLRAAIRTGWIDGDAGLTILLTVQALLMFVGLPLIAMHAVGRVVIDAGHLLFAAVCLSALTNRRSVKAALLGGVAILAAGPFAFDWLGLDGDIAHEAVLVIALGFNGLVTVLVARRAFGPGPVTGHRLQGAVFVYLNTASLFAIGFTLLELHAPGAFRFGSGGQIDGAPGTRTAEMSYFSLATITTTGYGDLVPVHPFARSMANLESVFGTLFPATFVARLVALRLAHATPRPRDPGRPMTPCETDDGPPLV